MRLISQTQLEVPCHITSDEIRCHEQVNAVVRGSEIVNGNNAVVAVLLRMLAIFDSAFM